MKRPVLLGDLMFLWSPTRLHPLALRHEAVGGSGKAMLAAARGRHPALSLHQQGALSPSSLVSLDPQQRERQVAEAEARQYRVRRALLIPASPDPGHGGGALVARV